MKRNVIGMYKQGLANIWWTWLIWEEAICIYENTEVDILNNLYTVYYNISLCIILKFVTWFYILFKKISTININSILIQWSFDKWKSIEQVNNE